MPVQEQRIAQLILRHLLKEISSDERRELMDGYVNRSTANRNKFRELSDRRSLKKKLSDFYSLPDGLSGKKLPSILSLRALKK